MAATLVDRESAESRCRSTKPSRSSSIASLEVRLGLSRTQEDWYQPLVTLGAVAIGALAGALVRREVPVFRAALLPYTGWRLIQVEPESTTTRFRLGLV